jgi:hypothetical protein
MGKSTATTEAPVKTFQGRLLQRDERQPHIFGIDSGVALNHQGHVAAKLPGPANTRRVPGPYRWPLSF